MPAKTNLIMTNDIQVTAREIDFVTRFERNWEHLREILGIMRPIKKTYPERFLNQNMQRVHYRMEILVRARKSLTANSL